MRGLTSEGPDKTDCRNKIDGGQCVIKHKKMQLGEEKLIPMCKMTASDLIVTMQ